MGMGLAIFLAFVTFGSTSFTVISHAAGGGSEATMNWLGVLLLIGACGKSAQVPLQAWLLDAMEGPTPVSALIHAATMVTAGVYLVTRSNFVFEHAPVARTVVVVVATVTLLWGAILGCAKDDIKKALAGSTMSQIGYMMLGAGLGTAGYAFAIFHLLTHGFFKANMFLGAGSVMHGMDDDVNMRHYGALNKALPVTFATFAMGYLAIIGFPGFSGFWSKDKIIEVALTERPLVGICALLGAGITGFYMTRLMLLTFFTGQRWDKDVHPHESPWVMTGPLVVLAALSVLGGMLLIGNWIVDWLSPVVGTAPEHHPPMPGPVISLLAVLVVAVGVAAAWFLVGQRDVPREAPQDVSFVTRAARADLYGDAINDTLVGRPGAALVRGSVATDHGLVDGIFRAIGTTVTGTGVGLRYLQTGYVRSYALSILGGAVVLVLTLVAVNL
jgi:NADH-quinone oxidoreductase subunit L